MKLDQVSFQTGSQSRTWTLACVARSCYVHGADTTLWETSFLANVTFMDCWPRWTVVTFLAHVTTWIADLLNCSQWGVPIAATFEVDEQVRNNAQYVLTQVLQYSSSLRNSSNVFIRTHLKLWQMHSLNKYQIGCWKPHLRDSCCSGACFASLLACRH